MNGLANEQRTFRVVRCIENPCGAVLVQVLPPHQPQSVTRLVVDAEGPLATAIGPRALAVEASKSAAIEEMTNIFTRLLPNTRERGKAPPLHQNPSRNGDLVPPPPREV
jgi:hypothetical protein